MEVAIQYLDGVRFEVQARGHRVTCDQPVNNGGHDLGMTPPEFLLAALGSCAAYYAVEYLRARKLPFDGVRATVECQKLTGPARLDHFSVKVQPPALNERHQEGLLRAVKSCLVHNTMLHAPRIDVALDVPVRVT